MTGTFIDTSKGRKVGILRCLHLISIRRVSQFRLSEQSTIDLGAYKQKITFHNSGDWKSKDEDASMSEFWKESSLGSRLPSSH